MCECNVKKKTFVSALGCVWNGGVSYHQPAKYPLSYDAQ